MLDIFKALIKQERPDFILDLTTVGHREVSVASCKYSKNGKFYAATTWFTEVFIAPSLSDLLLAASNSKVEILSDVAELNSFDTKQECLGHRNITSADIDSALTQAHSRLDDYIRIAFADNQYGDHVISGFVLSPLPGVSLKVIGADGIVGTLMLYLNGDIKPVLNLKPRFSEYIQSAHKLLTTRNSSVCPLKLE